MIHIEQRNDLGWRKAWRLLNGSVELVVPEDVGPRIVRFAVTDGSNVFAELPDFQVPGMTGGWQIYGGHRLWHSPEDALRTYYPDNQPVTVVPGADGLIIEQETESTTQLQKTLEIKLNDTSVTVTHKICNKSLWPLRYAAWSISAMAPGGIAFTRLRAQKSENLCVPDIGVNIWPHTSMADPRALWGDQYFMLQHDASIHQPFKAGLVNDVNWLAYQNGSSLFVKTFDKAPDAVYPDHDSSIALYTCDRFSEIESLSPLCVVHPGEAITHREYWYLFSVDQPLSGLDEEQLIAMPWLEKIHRLAHNGCEPDSIKSKRFY